MPEELVRKSTKASSEGEKMAVVFTSVGPRYTEEGLSSN